MEKLQSVMQTMQQERDLEAAADRFHEQKSLKDKNYVPPDTRQRAVELMPVNSWT